MYTYNNATFRTKIISPGNLKLKCSQLSLFIFFFKFIRKMNDIFISLIWASRKATYRNFLEV